MAPFPPRKLLTLKNILLFSETTALVVAAVNLIRDKMQMDRTISDYQRHKENLKPKLFGLRSTFFAPQNPDIHNSFRTGTAFLVSPNLLLTSAHVIGHVAPEKSYDDRLIHKSYLADTVAFQTGNKTLETTPVAVHFGTGIAVLKVETKNKQMLHQQHCELKEGSLVGVGDLLFSISVFPEKGYYYDKFGVVGNVGEMVGEKAPWPLDNGDEVEWMEIIRLYDDRDDVGKDDDDVTNGSSDGVMCSGGFGGSPWVNLSGEIVGLSSWEMATDKPRQMPLMYAVPSVHFKEVLDYAKSKGPDDPVVMDRWIDDSR